MFLLSLGIKAQTTNTPVLTWDQEVGCIEYDDERSLPYVYTFESMDQGECLRFCEGSTVNYTLQAANVAAVTWQPTGGTLQPGSTNTNAAVQWGSSGMGSLTITISYTNGMVDIRTICVEKIVSPRAEFKINGIDPDQREFCIDMPISFDNLSTPNNGSDIVHYFWDFGDGTTSSLFEPTHAYSNGGHYAVRLTVTNSCNCTSEYVMKIDISDVKAIEITCANVTCEFDQETYEANDGCGGEWEVIGGTVVGGGTGNPFVTVVWDQVDPEDGFGYVSYKSDCGCPYWNTVKIPVVLHNGIIKGPDIICEGKQGRFNLPQWPVTEFDWALDGNPNHQQLVYVDHRNEVVVDGLVPGDYVLSVDYKNTLYENCVGTAKIHFTVVENVEVVTSGSLTFCTGTSKSFSSSNGQPVTWQIRLGEAVVYTATGVSTSYTFNTGGTYVVTANQGGCESEPVVIDVIAKPTVPGGISGPDKVCLNVPYIYSVSEDDPEAVYVWSVVPAANGSVVGNNAGTQAEIIITAPTATVRVVKQYTKNGVTCYSDPVDYAVSQLVPNPTIINDSGLTLFCPSSVYTFTANMNGFVADHIEWEIVGIQSPGNYTTNFGNVIDGINSATATVSFNEISNGVNTGELRLKVTKCGVTTTKTYTVTVVSPPTLTVSLDNICPGDDSFPVTVTTSASSGTLEFRYSNNQGAIHTESFSTSGTHTFSIPQEFVASTTNSVGATLIVTLKETSGCQQKVTVNQPVLILPLVTVEIYLSKRTLCESSTTDSVSITATVSTGITATTDFAWYKDNETTPFETTNGVAGATISVNETGTYYVVVTDTNGCEIKSNPKGISDYCGSSGGGCFGVTPTLTYDWINCTTLEVTATYTSMTNVSGFYFTASEGGIIDPVVTNPNPNIYVAQIQFTEPGGHNVGVQTNYTDCGAVGRSSINIPKAYKPDLRYEVVCNGDGTYDVILYNNSKLYLIDIGDINFSYTGPGVPAAPPTAQSVTIPNLTAGTYTYNLKLSTNLQCSDLSSTLYPSPEHDVDIPDCETEITFTLLPQPVLNFSLLPQYCAEEPITLTIGSPQPGYEYSWWFNGTHYKVDGTGAVDINVSEEGSLGITLKALASDGCEYSSALQTTTIKKANFFGSISPNPVDACEGNVPALSFSPNPFTATPTSVIWMHDDQQVATTATYTPTESGSYWAVLVNGDGCKFYGTVNNPAIVTVRKPPFVSINGNTSVCFGEDTVLTGIVTDPTVEHRWVGSGLPFGYTNWVTGIGTNLNVPLNGLATGTYTYTLHARPVSDPSCASQFTVTVTVHPQVTAPTISYVVTNCQPYTLRLTASGPAAGTYNWSNGMTGQTIEVLHGGAYSVTYTAPTGCSATGYNNNIPHSPERALWVVPTGCYGLCGYRGYLIGPWGQYAGFEWSVDGMVLQTGTGTILNQSIVQPGHYQLAVTQNGCTFYSSTPFIDPGACSRAANTGSSNVVTAFALSPNPAVDVTTASYDTGTQNATAITVHDVTGVQRLQQNVSGTTGEVLLNVSHLAPGTYLVNLHAGGTVVAQQKLIKK